MKAKDNMFDDLREIISELETEYHTCLSTLEATSDMRQQVQDIAQLDRIVRGLYQCIEGLQPIWYEVKYKYDEVDRPEPPF